MTWKLLHIFLVMNLLNYCEAICEDTEETETTHVLQHYDNYGRYVPEQTSVSLINLTVVCQEVELPMTWSKESGSEYDCENCPKVMKIFNSNISTIPSSAFEGLSSFTVLRISNVRLEKLKPGAFNSLHYLEELYLNDNKLTSIGAGIFNSLTNLKILDLSINKIENIDIDTLTGLPNLRELNISSNRLVSFESAILDQNILLLEYIDLSSNLLKNIDIPTVSTKIKNMDLSINNISELNFCPFELESLKISNNDIACLGNSHCSTIFRIVNFDASYNKIAELNSSIFLNLTDLKYLYLEFNNISSIPTGLFSDMKKLKVLNLSHNQLQQFQHGTFENLENLEILDISYNKIITLKRYLHPLINLKKLYIQGNKIIFLNGEQLSTDLPSLSFISLESNTFSCSRLIEVIASFRKNAVVVEYGKAKTISNIHGITCFDDEHSKDSSTRATVDVSSKFDNILSKLQQLLNGDLRKSVMNDYFNKEFKNSSFYKYLESFHRVDLPKFNETALFHYLNDGFDNSKFFKYLEGLEKKDNSTNEFNKRVLELLDSNTKNFTEYLNESKKNGDIFLSKNEMYDYFNENFRNSSFYKYLENLRVSNDIFSRSFVSAEGPSDFVLGNENRDLLLTIVIFLVAIFLIMIVFLYLGLRKTSRGNVERVELLES
nr:toll-like receptor Tollo isoform X2 [Leptinotarsa decemlineata]